MTKKELGLILGAQITAERRRQGLSMYALAERAALAQSVIQHLCAGKSTQCSVYTLTRVADVLGLSLDWILGRQ